MATSGRDANLTWRIAPKGGDAPASLTQSRSGRGALCGLRL